MSKWKKAAEPSSVRYSKLNVRYSIFAFFLTVGVSLGADWTQFRGPGGSAVSPENNLPAAWSQTENIRWKAALPNRGLSCPVVANGRVYVTASSGYKESRLHVLCFESNSGKKLWERQFWSTGGTQCHPKTCMAAPTPVTDGERVYALFATGDLACFDKDGDLVWYRGLVPDYPEITNQVGMAASPILYKDLLILPMDNAGQSFVAGIDKSTGRNRWKVERKREINWVSPFLFEHAGLAEVLLQSLGELAAYEPETGKKLWTLSEQGLPNVPTSTAADGVLFAPANGVTAFKAGTDGKPPQAAWKENKLRSNYASPVCYEGKVYGITPTPALTCADAKDGKVLWQQRLKGKYSASPVAGDGKIYCVDEEGLATVLEAGKDPKILSENKLDGAFLATPAIADGCIYLRSDQHLYCIAKKER